MTVPTVDVLIVGTGIMGAAVARRLTELRPRTTITMVDGAPPIDPVPGRHLHDTDDPAVREAYGVRVSSGVQALYLGADPTPDLGGSTADARPGMYSPTAFGHDMTALPAAAFAWNVGGMGVHWTAACPPPWGDEAFDDGTGQWDDDVAVATRLLHVHPDPFGVSRPGRRLLSALTDEFGPQSAPNRGPQPMPMAAQPGDRHVRRTGPSVIFPALGRRPTPGLTVHRGHVTRLVHDGNTVTAVDVTDLTTGETAHLRARATVVCADPLRSPQLLFASGIRPSALGRWFNEHAFLTGRVLVDLDRHGIRRDELPTELPGEWLVGSYWLPHSGTRQPFHGQIMDSVPRDDDGRPLGYQAGLSWYVPTELRESTRIAFSTTELDVTGMPRMTAHFTYSAADLAAIEAARASQRRAGECLGEFDPATDSALLDPGASLHFTGTARIGPSDDGTSVCDPDTRVWGFDNLYVAGGAAVPTAVVGNSTLVGTVTAVRAARALAARLGRA